MQIQPDDKPLVNQSAAGSLHVLYYMHAPWLTPGPILSQETDRV